MLQKDYQSTTTPHHHPQALKGCIEACNAKVALHAEDLHKLEEVLRSKGGDPTQKLEIEDALAIKVRSFYFMKCSLGVR